MCWYFDVEEAFDGDKIRIFSADLARVVDKISTHSQLYAIVFYFQGVLFSDYAKISGSATLGNVCMLNKT